MPWNSKEYPSAFKAIDDKNKRNKAIRQAEAIRKSCLKQGDKSEKVCARIAIAKALKDAKSNTETEMLDLNDVLLARTSSLAEIKKNFDDNVLGVDVSIDVNHDHTRGAAGWIKKLQIGKSTTKTDKKALFALVDWTKYGEEEVLPRYRYISSEFGKFTDPETLEKTNNVLKAATLTNRPFIRGMESVSAEDKRIEILREGDYTHPIFGELNITAEDTEMFKEGENMKMEDIRDLLQDRGVKLEDDSDLSEALTEYLDNLDNKLEDHTEKVDSLETQLEEKVKAFDDLKAEIEDVDGEGTNLEEVQAKLVTLEEKADTLAESNTALTKKLADAERDAFLEEQVSAGKMFPAEREHFAKLYDKDEDTVKAMLEDRGEVVDLEEHGSDEDTRNVTFEDKLHEKAEEIMKNKDIGYKDAVLEAADQLGEEE